VLLYFRPRFGEVGKIRDRWCGVPDSYHPRENGYLVIFALQALKDVFDVILAHCVCSMVGFLFGMDHQLETDFIGACLYNLC
jgi:hypothetical protein